MFEGKPYCSKDYYEKFAPKCGACSEAIVNNCITALKKQWHVECFVCFVSTTLVYKSIIYATCTDLCYMY